MIFKKFNLKWLKSKEFCIFYGGLVCFIRNIPGEMELRGDLEKIPRGPISNLPNTPRRSRGVFGRFEIGPRGIFEIPHEGCQKFNEAKPSWIFDIPSGVSRKIARVARGNGNKYNFAHIATELRNVARGIYY